MKKKRLMYALLVPAMFFSISHCVTAQDSAAMTNDDNAKIDSLDRVYDQQETARDKERKNSESLSDLKSEKKETATKAKEARRVEAEANDAAKESRMAYRKEKNAQKARQQADKQKRKAEKARDISDQN